MVNFSHATQKPQRWQPLGFSCINENYDRHKKEAVWNSIQLHDLSGNRTRVYAVRGRRLDRLTNRPYLILFNRGDVIRTRDLCVPNAALYQTEPRLDVFKAFCFVLFTSDSYIIAWPWKKCKRFFEKISIFWKKVISENLPGSGKSPQSLIL